MYTMYNTAIGRGKEGMEQKKPKPAPIIKNIEHKYDLFKNGSWGCDRVHRTPSTFILHKRIIRLLRRLTIPWQRRQKLLLHRERHSVTVRVHKVVQRVVGKVARGRSVLRRVHHFAALRQMVAPPVPVPFPHREWSRDRIRVFFLHPGKNVWGKGRRQVIVTSRSLGSRRGSRRWSRWRGITAIASRRGLGSGRGSRRWSR